MGCNQRRSVLCFLFPPNLKAARERLTILRRPVLAAGPRLVVQLVFIGALIGCVWPHSRTEVTPGT